MLINAIYNNLVGTNGGTQLTSQPSLSAVQTELSSLIGTLARVRPALRAAARGSSTAACAAVMSSASTLVN